MTLSPLSPTQFPPWRREPVDSATLWNLVRAGTSGDDEIARVVDRAGLDAVVGALLDEVLFRCAAPQNTTEVDIRLDLVHGAGGRSVVLRLLAGRPIAVVDAAGATIQEPRSMRTTMAQATASPLWNRRGSFSPSDTARQISRSTT